MSIYLSLFVCILGLVIFFVTGNPTTPPPSSINVKFNQLSLYMFWVGLLAFFLTWPGSHQSINLLR